MREEAHIVQLLNCTWDWLRFSAALPAVLAGGLGISSQVVLGTSVHPGSALALTLGVFAIYQLDRLLSAGRDDADAHPDRAKWTTDHAGSLRWALVTAAILAVVLGTPVADDHPVIVASASLISIVYAIAFGQGGKRLKDVWWLKPVLVAGVWAVVVGSLVLPGSRSAASALAWFVLYRFLFLLTNVLLCEIVEARSDEFAVPGIVSKLGITRTLLTARLAGCAALVAGVFAASHTRVPALVIADATGVVALLVLSFPGCLSRIRESSVVDLATLWPVAVTVVAILTI